MQLAPLQTFNFQEAYTESTHWPQTTCGCSMGRHTPGRINSIKWRTLGFMGPCELAVEGV